MDGSPRDGCAHGGGFVCRLCYLVGCPATPRTAVAQSAVQIVQTVQAVQRLKLSGAVERSEAIEQLETRTLRWRFSTISPPVLPSRLPRSISSTVFWDHSLGRLSV